MEDNKEFRFQDDLFGFIVEEFNDTIADLFSRGFRLLTKEEASSVSSLFQYAPQIIAQKISEGRFREAFAEATKDSYKIVMDVGRYLAESKKNPGRFSSNTFDSKNKNMRPAEWIANNTALSVQQAEQMIANMFNAASFITGQYFQAQISQTMALLDSDVKGIRDFLESNEQSEFDSAIGWMESRAKHLSFIRVDASRRQHTAQDVGNMNRYFRHVINRCRDRISGIIGGFKTSDNEEQVTQNINSIVRNIILYYRALNLFCEGINMEICLDEVTDIRELQIYHDDDMQQKITEYRLFFDQTAEQINEYLGSVDVYSKPGIGQSLISFGKGTLSFGVHVLGLGIWGAIPGAMDGVSIAKESQKKYSKENNEKRNAMFRSINERVQLCRNISPLNKAIGALEDYMRTAQRTEFVRVGNQIYTNMPHQGTHGDGSMC